MYIEQLKMDVDVDRSDLESSDHQIEQKWQNGEQIHQVHGADEELQLSRGARKTDLNRI